MFQRPIIFLSYSALNSFTTLSTIFVTSLAPGDGIGNVFHYFLNPEI